MKKLMMIAAITVLLASCSSGWKCTSRYCEKTETSAKQKQNA